MPNVSEYENQDDWMGACMPAMMGEGKEQDEAAAACMSMWGEKKSFYDMPMEDAVKHFLKAGARHSAQDRKDMQTLHDIAIKQGAKCKSMMKFNPLKALSETDEELTVGNHIILFGGRDLTGYAIGKNADGSLGEFFTKSTDLESDYTKTGRLYVDFEHGRDPDDVGNTKHNILGYVDWKTKSVDDEGVFVKRVLY